MMKLFNQQLELSHKLTRRTKDEEGYRALLERILGCSTDATVISTSEHVAPFNLAHTVSFVLPQLGIQVAGLRESFLVLILAGSLIPLDNSHYPRGFLLPEGAQVPDRFNLYPSSMNKKAPLLLPPASGNYDDNKANRFFNAYPWLKPAFNETSRFETFADQLAYCMELISDQWFAGALSSKLCVKSLEAIAQRMLLQLMSADDGIVSAILFDSRTRGEIAKRLHGVFCAWGDRQGSFLFWGQQNSRPVRLREHSGCLIGDQISIPLQKDNIMEGLRTGILWPGVFLSLLAVSYLPSLPISGGPKQFQYYRQMIETANFALGERRPLELSERGYMSFEPASLLSQRNKDCQLPNSGTGLALAQPDLDVNFLLEQLRATEVVRQNEVEFRYE